MTCSFQYSFGPTRIQPVMEPKIHSLSTTCIRYTSQKLSKVRNGLNKKHLTLHSAVTTISAPLELTSCRNNEKHFSVGDSFYTHKYNEINKQPPSLTTFSTSSTNTIGSTADFLPTPTSTISYSSRLACVRDCSLEQVDSSQIDQIDIAIKDEESDSEKNAAIETDKSGLYNDRYMPQYYATLQKLMGIPVAEDNKAKCRTNTAVLISLSPSALSAANFARHRRQRKNLRTVV